MPARELPLPSAPVGRSHLPQGDGFSGGGKVSGIAIRRPLGGAGERSEPEGVSSPQTSSPSQALTRQIPPFVTYGDIFPRSGGSLSSKGEPLAKPVTWHLNRKLYRDDGEGEGANRSAALSQKAALQLPFPVTTPPVKMEHRSVRRRSGVPKYKIIFPLNMRSNDDDRRQWRKQGGVVGAAASKTRVPPKARCGCWVPQPVSQRRPF